MNRALFISTLIFVLTWVGGCAYGQEQKDSLREIDCEKVFAFASEMPVYPGGGEALVADMIAIVKRVSCQATGARYLSFIVTDEGKVKSPVFQPGNLKGCSEMLEKEFGSLPLWIPAKQTGVPVCVNVTIPLK